MTISRKISLFVRVSVVVVVIALIVSLSALFVNSASANESDSTAQTSNLANDDANNDEVTLYYKLEGTTLHISSTAGVGYGQTTDAKHLWPGKMDTTKVIFEGYVRPNTCRGWFVEFIHLNTINWENFDSSNVTSMKSMFFTCTSLTSLDLSSFNTSKVTSFDSMFNTCTNLSSLNISSFDTSSCTTFVNMFNECKSLASVDLSNFDTSSATDFHLMFAGCSKLENLDLSKFNTSAASNFHYMFLNCKSLKTLDISGFDTSRIVSKTKDGVETSTQSMFNGCSALITIYASEKFDISSILDAQNFKGINMFKGCTSLQGGSGTVYDSTPYAETANDSNDGKYAHIDGGAGNSGYFTDKNKGYNILEGADGTYKVGSGMPFVIRIAADFANFAGKVNIDNCVLDTCNYDAKAGSTIISLHPDFLDTLTPGKYNVGIVFVDQIVNTTITIDGNNDAQTSVASSTTATYDPMPFITVIALVIAFFVAMICTVFASRKYAKI